MLGPHQFFIIRSTWTLTLNREGLRAAFKQATNLPQFIVIGMAKVIVSLSINWILITIVC